MKMKKVTIKVKQNVWQPMDFRSMSSYFEAICPGYIVHRHLGENRFEVLYEVK